MYRLNIIKEITENLTSLRYDVYYIEVTKEKFRIEASKDVNGISVVIAVTPEKVYVDASKREFYISTELEDIKELKEFEKSLVKEYRKFLKVRRKGRRELKKLGFVNRGGIYEKNYKIGDIEIEVFVNLYDRRIGINGHFETKNLEKLVEEVKKLDEKLK